MNKSGILAGIVFVSFVGAFVEPATADVTSIWSGGSTNWSDAANWSNIPPTIIAYPNDGNGGLAYDAYVDSGAAALSQNITIQQLYLSGGTIDGSFNLTVSNLISWTAGTIGGSGTTTADGTLLINPGGSSVDLDARTLVIAGSAMLTNGHIVSSTEAVLSNLLGVTFTIADDSSFLVGGEVNTSGPFLNAGTLLKSGAGDNSSGYGAGISEINWPLTNSGTVLINVGTLSIDGGGSSSGIITVAPPAHVAFLGSYTLLNGTLSGAGVVQFNGGTVTISNTVTAFGGLQVIVSNGVLNALGILTNTAPFQLSAGTLTGPGTLVSSGQVVWTGGTMGGSGTTIADGPLVINPGGSSVDLDMRTLVTAGSATLTNGHIVSSTEAVLSNLLGVTFTIADDSSFLVGGEVNTSGPFLNAGTLLKSGAGDNSSGQGAGTSVMLWSLRNSGTIQVNVGTLSIDGGGSSSGIITVTSPGRVAFPDSYTLLNGTLSGAGVVQFNGGTVTITGTVNAVTGSQILLSSGALTGPGTLVSSGQVVWTGGTMGGSGTTIADGPLVINPGGSSVDLDMRTLVTAGSATLTNGHIVSSTEAVLSNLLGVTFTIADDSSFLVGGEVNTSGPFLNAGTLLKSGAGDNSSGQGAGTSVMLWSLRNSGTIQVNVGTLSFSGGYVQTAGATILNGGTLASSTPLTIQGGSIIGTGTVVATVLNNGVLSPGIGGAGALSISGPLTQQSGANLLMEIGGYARGTQYSFVGVGGTATFGGHLTLSIINGFGSSMTNGAGFTLLTSGAVIKGAFTNVTNGGTLTTSDGFARFTVSYGGSNLVLNGLQVVDSVGDGIPNWWRAQYFGGTGGTTNSSSCATCDADGTGQDNLFKYVAGLDPIDPTSVFVLLIQSVSGQPTQKNLLFNHEVSGRTYTPQFSTNLVSGSWAALTGFSGPSTNIDQITVTDLSATQTQKFYRIDISLP